MADRKNYMQNYYKAKQDRSQQDPHPDDEAVASLFDLFRLKARMMESGNTIVADWAWLQKAFETAGARNASDSCARIIQQLRPH